jgi:hypothetical protein
MRLKLYKIKKLIHNLPGLVSENDAVSASHNGTGTCISGSSFDNEKQKFYQSKKMMKIFNGFKVTINICIPITLIFILLFVLQMRFFLHLSSF